MELKIEELQKGDEVLVASNGKFRYLKLLRAPSKSPKTGRWKSIQCLTKVEKIDKSYIGFRGTFVKYIQKVYKCVPPEETGEWVFS